MKKTILLIALLFYSAFMFSQIDENTGWRSTGLTTAQLNALSGTLKTGLTIMDTTLGVVVSWNGSAFIPITSAGSFATLTGLARDNTDLNAELDLKADVSAIPTVINNLTSTSTTAALSAAQGKVLQDGKLSLSGGTMSGDIDFNYFYGLENMDFIDMTMNGVDDKFLRFILNDGATDQFWLAPDNGSGFETTLMYDYSDDEWQIDNVRIATVDDIAGGGTDDQTAAEVPITDSGLYFTGTNVETALQELGAGTAGGSFGIVASGTSVFTSATTQVVTHSLGYAPDISRILLSINTSASVLPHAYVSATSTTTISITTTNTGGSTINVGWAIFGTGSTTPLVGSEVATLLDTEIGSAVWRTDNQTATEVPFTPNGSIAATDVQAAIEEVRDEAGGGGLASTDIDTSAELAAILTDESGTAGGFVRATGATLVAPVLGVATATSINGRDITADGATLDGIDTGPEIKALYEAEDDTNAYTDTEKTKLGYLTLSDVWDGDAAKVVIAGAEQWTRKVTSLTSPAPNDSNYPTAKAVSDAINASKLLSRIAETTSKTAELTDVDGMIDFTSATDVVYTIPENASVAFDIGAIIMARRNGAGNVSIAYSGSATGDAARTYQYDESIGMLKTGTDTWVVINAPKPDYETITVALSDTTSDIVAADDVDSILMEFDMYVESVSCFVQTPGTATGFTIDININGTSILSTKLTTDATEQKSSDATIPAVISTNVLSAGDIINYDLTAVPTGAQRLKVSINGYRL